MMGQVEEFQDLEKEFLLWQHKKMWKLQAQMVMGMKIGHVP